MLQDAQVLRDGGPGDRERLGQLADGQLTLGEPGEDRPPRLVAESGVDGIQRRDIGNHLVTNLVTRRVRSRRSSSELSLWQTP